MRQEYRVPQKKSVLFRAPGLVIGAVAFGAAGGWTASDMLASWGASGGSGLSCRIKGNISIETGERIFHVPGQRYDEQTKISPTYGERWFCSEFKLGPPAGGKRNRNERRWPELERPLAWRPCRSPAGARHSWPISLVNDEMWTSAR